MDMKSTKRFLDTDICLLSLMWDVPTDTMGKKLIGRYDNSLGGFPDFKMRMVCATFHCAGKYPLSKTALNK
jgi:hypothetical protein